MLTSFNFAMQELTRNGNFLCVFSSLKMQKRNYC